MAANDIEAVTGGAANGANAYSLMQTPADKSLVGGNISKAARSLLRAHFMSVGRPLNKLLPRGEAFSGGQLQDIVREFHLTRDQVSRQLQNYKEEKYQHTQINIILGSSDLGQRKHDSLSMSTLDFVMETLKKISNPCPHPVDSADFNNYSSLIHEFPPAIGTYLRLLVVSPENWCISLLDSLVDFWIDAMAEIFPQTLAGIPNAQSGFDRWKQSYMKTFIDNFVAEYDSTSLTQTITKITFGHLGGFLHTSLFMAWSHLVCDHEKLSVELPYDCLVGFLQDLSFTTVLDGQSTKPPRH